jgi:hypothetical protein
VTAKLEDIVTAEIKNSIIPGRQLSPQWTEWSPVFTIQYDIAYFYQLTLFIKNVLSVYPL